MALRAPLLAESKEDQPGTSATNDIFSQQFIHSQQVYFRMACESAGLKAMTKDLESTYLDPIITSMSKLSLGEKSPEQAKDLIKQIEDARTNFVTQYKSSFKKSTLTQMEAAFAKLLDHTRSHLKSSYASLTSEINSSAFVADASISEAKLRKLKDLCCILACIGWCPLENIITICNWCGADQHGNCCSGGECASADFANGNWSMWAPMGSIRSLRRDIDEQDKLIQQQTPIAMAMI